RFRGGRARRFVRRSDFSVGGNQPEVTLKDRSCQVVSHGTDRRYGAGGEEMATSSLHVIDGVPAMPQPNDLSRSLVALDQNSTIIAVIEMSQSSWLVAGMLPGIERRLGIGQDPLRRWRVLRWQYGAGGAATRARRHPGRPDRHHRRLQGRPADPFARR